MTNTRNVSINQLPDANYALAVTGDVSVNGAIYGSGTNGLGIGGAPDADEFQVYMAAKFKNDVTFDATKNLKMGEDNIWHAGNAGTGKGYDVDMVDGIHASGFTPAGGWNSLPACTYVSVDDPTGVIDITGDMRSSLSDGMRLKLTNGGNVIKGIITNVNQTLQSGNTRITFLHEVDPTDSQAIYLMANSEITNPYYSTAKAPQGFPLSPRKWMVFTYIGAVTDYSVSNPTAGT
jgi:hypothetical protein